MDHLVVRNLSNLVAAEREGVKAVVAALDESVFSTVLSAIERTDKAFRCSRELTRLDKSSVHLTVRSLCSHIVCLITVPGVYSVHYENTISQSVS